MTARTTRTSILVMALVMFAGFQNCSKVNFAADENALNKSQGDGLEDVDFPIDEPLDPDLVNTPMPSPTPLQDNEDPVPPSSGSDCAKFAAGEDVEASRTLSGVNVRIRKHRGSLTVAQSETLELSNIRGVVYARTSEARHLRNMRGGLCLVADSLMHLNNHRGNVEIIGAQISSINNTRGTLILDGSSIDRLSNHRGNIILRNGAQIGELVNIRGDIITEESAPLVADASSI